MTDYRKLNSKVDEHYTQIRDGSVQEQVTYNRLDSIDIGGSLNRHVDLQIVYIFVGVCTGRLNRSS